MGKVRFTSDGSLIEAIQQGGRARELATAFLMKEHLGFVNKLRYKLRLTSDEALDCYIDALADVVEQIGNHTFKGLSKVSTYLYQITYFRCVDTCRKKSRDPQIQSEFPELEDLSRQVSRQIETEAEVKKLVNFLDRMGSPCREILLDWGWWGFSMQEIAKRNNLKSPDIAKSRKYQCLQQLRKKMGLK